jgi:succinate dehydrogenase / fumarate reductase, cytochrome b subunit
MAAAWARIGCAEVAATRSQPAGIYSTAVGKKYAMALSGIVLMFYVLTHMLGNLRIYISAASLDDYSHWLRRIGDPLVPGQTTLYVIRAVLLAALIVHVHGAYELTRINHRARPDAYRSRRDYVAADFASRTMRWTGVIVLLFVVFHLLDLTWGPANPDFVAGRPYHNVTESLQRWPVALVYIAANLALAVHLYHGAWSLFQSMGWQAGRRWRRHFAIAFMVVVAGGNISFPIAVLTGVVG